jgi:hypothetical protein
MAKTSQNSYRGLLARIVLWSLVSLLCFWIPILAGYHYAVDDPGLAIVVVLGVPIVALTAAMVIPALSGMGQVLETCPKGRRRVLSLVAWALSAPALGAIVIVWTVIIVVIVCGVYVALGGGAAR